MAIELLPAFKKAAISLDAQRRRVQARVGWQRSGRRWRLSSSVGSSLPTRVSLNINRVASCMALDAYMGRTFRIHLCIRLTDSHADVAESITPLKIMGRIKTIQLKVVA